MVMHNSYVEKIKVGNTRVKNTLLKSTNKTIFISLFQTIRLTSEVHIINNQYVSQKLKVYHLNLQYEKKNI